MTQFTIELDCESDGRWIAEIPAVPGAMCYGSSKEEASRKAEALALRILAGDNPQDNEWCAGAYRQFILDDSSEDATYDSYR